MLAYIIRRLGLMFPTLLGVLAVVFFVMAYAPGGFGGKGLSVEGAQSEGYEARRYKKQQERRYGSNLSKPAQFGRWLNQVSPVGFRMSDQVAFTDDQRAAAGAALADLPAAADARDRRRLVAFTLEWAAYDALDPADAAAQLAERLADPVAAMALFDELDLSLEPSVAAELKRDIAGRLERRGLASAQNKLVEELSFELSGVSRVRFDLFTLKAPDLGSTIQGRRVADRLLEAVPITILLNVITIPLIYLISILTGVYAAKHRGGLFDVGSGLTFLGLWSVPTIWAGTLMITYLANRDFLHWFPTGGLHDLQADRMPFLPRFGDAGFERGWLLDAAWHLVLPVACMTYTGFAVMSRVMRGAMLDNLSSHFVRTARAKGLGESAVLWQHTFRNALLPLITMVSSILPALFVGSVVVEWIFSLNGMGNLGIMAAKAKDRDLVMAVTLMSGVLMLLSELARDLCYAVADPRVSYE